jgi:hypothetical protein
MEQKPFDFWKWSKSRHFDVFLEGMVTYKGQPQRSSIEAETALFEVEFTSKTQFNTRKFHQKTMFYKPWEVAKALRDGAYLGISKFLIFYVALPWQSQIQGSAETGLFEGKFTSKTQFKIHRKS